MNVTGDVDAGTGIIIVSRGDETYGVKTELLSIASALSARGWPVTVYALGAGDFADEARAIPGVRLIDDPGRPSRYDPEQFGKIGGYLRVLKSMFGVVRRLRRTLRSGGYGALLFCEHGLVLPLAACVLGTRLRSFWLMPNIVSSNYPGDLNRRLYAGAFGLSRMVPLPNSEFTKGTLGRAGRRARTLELGVQPHSFEPGKTRDPLADLIPASASRLLVMARLTPEKGQLQLIRSLFATSELTEMHAVIVGGPSNSPYERELRKAAASLGAEDRLHLIGTVTDTAAYYDVCDVVASVRLDPEPFGLSIVEAMLAGRPVLAHALGGPRDIVVDDETGWLIPGMQPIDLEEGLRRLLKDKPRWREMGEAARARALSRYTVATMTDELESVFAQNGLANPTIRPATDRKGGA